MHKYTIKKSIFIAAAVASAAIMVCSVSACAHKHKFGMWETVKEASCVLEGMEVRSCECGYEETQIIPATGHKMPDNWQFDGVTVIGDSAFLSCSSLTSVTIPESVTEIGWSAFEGCKKLNSITFNGTKAQWNDIEKGSIWDRDTSNYIIHCTDGDIEKQA